MRKWKDNTPIPIKHPKIYFAAIVFSYIVATVHYLQFGFLSIENIIGIGLASFMIYGIWFGGLYKIIRWYYEWRLKQSDNRWKPDWKK